MISCSSFSLMFFLIRCEGWSWDSYWSSIPCYTVSFYYSRLLASNDDNCDDGDIDGCSSSRSRTRTIRTIICTHSLTAALDQLRVVAIFIMSGPKLRIDKHWWVDPYLLPPAEAKFSVDDLVGISSQWPEVCRWRCRWIDVGLVTQVYPWIIGRCDLSQRPARTNQPRWHPPGSNLL